MRTVYPAGATVSFSTVALAAPPAFPATSRSRACTVSRPSSSPSTEIAGLACVAVKTLKLPDTAARPAEAMLYSHTDPTSAALRVKLRACRFAALIRAWSIDRPYPVGPTVSFTSPTCVPPTFPATSAARRDSTTSPCAKASKPATAPAVLTPLDTGVHWVWLNDASAWLPTVSLVNVMTAAPFTRLEASGATSVSTGATVSTTTL